MRAVLPLLALPALLIGAGCVRRQAEPPPGTLVISKEQEASWVRNFNPLSPGVVRWPTRAGIYEPLLVHSIARDEYVPWLATDYAFADDLRSLEVTVRQGVRWSDGETFGPADVVFTFELLKRFGALDRDGIHSFVSGVAAVGDRGVRFEFERPYVPGLEDIARVPIVPKHVWEHIADPVTFANPDPVATGPFTEVRRFADQVYELGRNPRYWQPGKPAVQALRFPAYPSNDQANLALITGEADWAGNFVPAIDRVFVKRDPAHNRYWFPLTGSTVFLYANTKRPPFEDARVRKALSMAIDRKLLVKVAAYSYSRPADATGMSDAWARWRDPDVAAGDWVKHQPGRAAVLLEEAGVRGTKVDILVVAGWSDWVRAAQVIARQLRAVGVDVSVRALDFSPWMEALQKGDFSLAISWSEEGATPYRFYRSLMATRTVKPLGAVASSNWHRFGDNRADTLLESFERTADPARQAAIARDLQALFSELAPAIPLYPNPQWGAYSTRRFEGFPSADDPWSMLTPNKDPECLLVLTGLRPKPRAGP